MKRIIVPTDFSSGAWKAFLYAMDLAQNFHVENLLVVNTYYEPHSGAATMRSLLQLMREEAEKNMKILQESIAELGFDKIINITCKTLHAPLVRALQNEVDGQSGQLIIMGTLGETGTLEQLIGSNTSAVMAKVKCPVLVIPPNAQFTFTGKLVLAADAEQLPVHLDLEVVKSFTANHPKPLLEVVQVVNNGLTQDPKAFESLLKGVPYQFQVISGEDIAVTLDQYIAVQPTDILMLIRLKRGLFQNLFHKSVTKKLALHAQVPLLILKE